MDQRPKNLSTDPFRLYLASASAAVAIMAILWLALFSALTHWRPGVRMAQGPFLTTERATIGDESSAVQKKLVR